jgi:hypothetical protein
MFHKYKKQLSIIMGILITIDFWMWYEFPSLSEKYGGLVSGLVTLLAIVGIGVCIKENGKGK